MHFDIIRTDFESLSNDIISLSYLVFRKKKLGISLDSLGPARFCPESTFIESEGLGLVANSRIAFCDIELKNRMV